MNALIFFFLSLSAYSQMQGLSLEEASKTINKDLPEIYDSVTKLMRTTVEYNNITYHFLVDANEKEFNWALPKVKAQVLRTICTKTREKYLLKQYKANIVYNYENVKGLSLGQFMIRPDHCP